MASHLRLCAERVTAGLGESECVGSPFGSRGSPAEEGLHLWQSRINDDCMTLEIDGVLISQARRRPGGWWEVDYWPRFFDRNQAISALLVTELLETGHDSDHPRVVALRKELR